LLQRREERHKVAGCKWDRRGRAVNKQPANTHIKSTMQISTHVQAFPQIDCVCMLKPRKNNHIWTEQNCQSDKCPYLQQYICSRNIFIFLTYSQSHAKKTHRRNTNKFKGFCRDRRNILISPPPLMHLMHDFDQILYQPVVVKKQDEIWYIYRADNKIRRELYKVIKKKTNQNRRCKLSVMSWRNPLEISAQCMGETICGFKRYFIINRIS
jgi:hypothetical protein